MINLSVSDPIDGFDKIGELRSAVGTDYCGDNQLVSVSKDGNRCIVLRGTQKVSEPSWLTWNRMFF
jgi:hypothetical protein